MFTRNTPTYVNWNLTSIIAKKKKIRTFQFKNIETNDQNESKLAQSDSKLALKL